MSSSFECVLYAQYAQDLVAGAAAVTDDGSMITLVAVLLQVQYVTLTLPPFWWYTIHGNSSASSQQTEPLMNNLIH